MKVYGGRIFNNGVQVRAIVATTSKAKAAKLVSTTIHHFNNYWSETNNAIEIQTATANPECVYVAIDRLEREYELLENDN